MALLVMLNNYFHDLATAVFAVSAFAAWRLDAALVGAFDPERARGVVRSIVRVAWGALVWVLAGGAGRALAFRRYEWMEAAGRAQIPVLVAKHVVLVSLVAVGLAILVRVRRRAVAAPRGPVALEDR